LISDTTCLVPVAGEVVSRKGSNILYLFGDKATTCPCASDILILDNGMRIGIDYVKRFLPSEYPGIELFDYPTDGIILGIDGREFKCKDKVTVELIAKGLHVLGTRDESYRYTVQDDLKIGSIYEVQLYPHVTVCRERPEKSKPQDSQHLVLLASALTKSAFWSLVYPDHEETTFCDGQFMPTRRNFYPFKVMLTLFAHFVKIRMELERSVMISARLVNQALFHSLHSIVDVQDSNEIIRSIRPVNERRTAFILHSVDFDKWFEINVTEAIDYKWVTHQNCMRILREELVSPACPVKICKKIAARGFSVSLKYILQLINRFELQHVGHFSYAYPQYDKVLLPLSYSFMEKRGLLFYYVLDAIMQFTIQNPRHTKAYEISLGSNRCGGRMSTFKHGIMDICDQYRQYKDMRRFKCDLIDFCLKESHLVRCSDLYDRMVHHGEINKSDGCLRARHDGDFGDHNCVRLDCKKVRIDRSIILSQHYKAPISYHSEDDDSDDLSDVSGMLKRQKKFFFFLN